LTEEALKGGGGYESKQDVKKKFTADLNNDKFIQIDGEERFRQKQF
jgi:hypothetical protein